MRSLVSVSAFREDIHTNKHEAWNRQFIYYIYKNKNKKKIVIFKKKNPNTVYLLHF